MLQPLSSKRTTGAGFTFSSPYYYDGMAYFGNESFVDVLKNQCVTLNVPALLYVLNILQPIMMFWKHPFPQTFSWFHLHLMDDRDDIE